MNSLVDPLQTAYFARSISSLAQQLGLPLWFVELRHQATHEELPNLPILRQGATQVRFSLSLSLSPTFFLTHTSEPCRR